VTRLRQNDTLSLIGKHDIKDELEKMHEKVSQVYYGIENLRKDLERMKEQNIHIRVSLNQIFTTLLLEFIIEN